MKANMTKHSYALPADATRLNIPQAADVIKIGGSVLDDSDTILEEISVLWKAGRRIAIVHGGGPVIDEWMRRMGVNPVFINGRRVTDAATLEIVRSVLIGKINSEIVRTLQILGVRAVGLCGMDGGMVRAKRANPELGLVGLAELANTDLIETLHTAGFMPVIAPLCLGPDNECLNVNADDVANSIARALRAENLVFLSNVSGVYSAGHTLIPALTAEHARKLIAQGVISGGMAPKIEACLAALDDVASVYIVEGSLPGVVLRAFSDHSGGAPVGTRIMRAAT